MSLLDFAQNKNSGGLGTSAPTAPSIGSGGSSNALLNYAGRGDTPGAPIKSAALQAVVGEDIASLPRNVDEARKMQEENPTLWGKVVKNLMKPVGLVATASEETGRVIGDLIAGDTSAALSDIRATPGKLGGIITGTRTRSFLDVFQENWEGAGLKMNETNEDGSFNSGAAFVNDFVPRILGTITDLTADPLNYIGGGLTKAGKLAEKASALKVAGETIAADSKLAAQIKMLGLSADDLVLAPTKAEQALRGQRALLTFLGNTRWEKTIYGGAPVYEALNTLKHGIAMSKAGQMISSVFSTKTSNQGFDVMKEHFDNLLDYRKGQVMDDALDIQNKLAKMTADDGARVIDVIETGKKSGIAAIDDLADQISTNLKGLAEKEKSLGLLNTEIENYFPHRLNLANESKTGWQKFKSFFYDASGQFIDDADATKASFGDAKVYSTKLDSSLKRNYEGTIQQIKRQFGINFEDRPAIAYAQRALGSAKAVTSKEFFESAKIFGTADDAAKLTDEFGRHITSARQVVDSMSPAEFEKLGGMKDLIGRAKINIRDAFKAEGLTDLAKQVDSLSASSLDDLERQLGKLVSKGGNANMVAVKVPELKGVKFPADIARQIDQYYAKVKPEELNKALKTFDSVQNWWKAQALTAPSYHVRNFVGNMWNNFLAGVVDPTDYYQAGAIQMGKNVQFTDDAGRLWTNDRILEAAKMSGVINEGWYAKDIETALTSELGGASWNPLKQNFGLFKANRAAGTALENNARLAHFINQLKGGSTIDNAAASVKKFLFDYGDLTTAEKQVFKRVAPFYTWTRKNIPLQIEQLLKQPGKFAAIPKITNAVESGVEKPNEKYLGDYIKDNVGIRVGTDEQGNTMYFLLGNWLPAAQAIDFLSQPAENFMMSVSPFFKTPVELWANQSSFFEDTFGQPSKIERYPEENQSWLGFTMRKKTAYILKNIRILNELDKLNPGAIFGDKDSPSLINRVAPGAGVELPGVGTITTSEKRGGRFTPEGTTTDRILQSLFGKTSLYNPNYAKQFYLWDTETKVRELERAIKDAQRDGQKEYAKRLNQELKAVLKERNK